MASTTKVFVSPGVYTSERDLTFVAQSVGVTTLGVVGETLQGPAFEPIFITNFDEFQTYFGGTNPEKFVNTQIPKYELSYIAKSYLSQSNQLFVTRVLGLSGYDAGPSWSIVTIGNVNPATIQATGTTGPVAVTFTGTTGGTVTLTSVPSSVNVGGNFYNPYTEFNGGTSSISSDLQSYISTQINLFATSSSASGATAILWGTSSASTLNSVTGVTSVNTITGSTEMFGVNNVNLTYANLSASTNDAWYYGLFNYYQGANDVNTYFGQSLGGALSGISTTPTSGVYSGTVAFYTTSYSGAPYSTYDDMVVATLRSRGISNYNSTQSGPFYEVSGTTDVTMVCTGGYSAVTKNPYSTFQISGVTYDGNNFTFETSMLNTQTNYLRNVFGASNFGKDRTEVPLFVEETYSALLQNGYRAGQIRGLYCDLVSLDKARSLDTDSIGFYLEQYQTPETPFVVSELRGNKVYKLFKFVLISDGNAANTYVKLSIGNISFNNGTFDVFVRDFFDNDQNVKVLESFTNCSLDPNQNNYIANKIGTSNGEYQVKSKFVMLEMSDEAPIDALPCGFEGYIMREYANATPPFVPFKTKYYSAGETIYNPPFGSTSGGDNPVISSGENPRRAYLGISNISGFDYDSILRTMPSQFGAPAKVAITEENNKIKIQMLSYDESGNLTEIVSNTLKNNVANYLSNYRMINDYISIETANVIDLGINVDVVLDNSQNQGIVISKIVNIISTYFQPSNRQLGENVFVSEIRRLIQSENGVISVSDILFFNKVGGEYSSSQTSQRYLDSETKQIELIDDTIFAEPKQTYQVRYPNKDIIVRVKNLKTTNFS